MGAKQNFNLGGINSHFNGLKDAGNMSPTQLALTYSKEQLQHMAQMGVINPTNAVIAGMNIDRISNTNAPPTSTISQDTFAPQQPQQGQQGQLPQQPPQGQPPQQGGLMSIPRPGQKYQQGGVVAFAEGDEVVAPSGFTGLKDLYDQIEAKRKGIPNTQSQALQDYYAGAPERAKARSERDHNMNLVNIGANIAAQSGVKGFELQNIGKGVVASMPGIKAADTEEEERRLLGVKGLADTEQKRRAEAIEGQKSAESIYTHLAQQQLISDKPTDFRSQVLNYVKAEKYKIAHGQREPIADELLTQEADRVIQKRLAEARLISAGAAVQNAETAGSNAETKRKQEQVAEFKAVVNEVTNDFSNVLNRMTKGTPANIYAELQKAGQTEEAERYKNKIIQKNYNILHGGGKNPIPLAANLPSDIQKLVDKKYK